MLQGGSAIAFPLPDLKWSLQFEPDAQVKQIQAQHIQFYHITGDTSKKEPPQVIVPSRPQPDKALSFKGARRIDSSADFIFYQALLRALSLECRDVDAIKGCIKIASQIPVGCGLGASAACSLGIAYLWKAWGWISDATVFERARKIENFFHSQSSGLDIAALMHSKPILFTHGRVEELQILWWPKFKLTYSGGRAYTASNVAQVIKWGEQNAGRISVVAQQMNTATRLALQALQSKRSPASFDKLRQAMDGAGQCFQEWGLITPAMQRHITQLRREGAVAAKPTGSGGGGYILSLWPPDK